MALVEPVEEGLQRRGVGAGRSRPSSSATGAIAGSSQAPTRRSATGQQRQGRGHGDSSRPTASFPPARRAPLVAAPRAGSVLGTGRVGPGHGSPPTNRRQRRTAPAPSGGAWPDRCAPDTGSSPRRLLDVFVLLLDPVAQAIETHDLGHVGARRRGSVVARYHVAASGKVAGSLVAIDQPPRPVGTIGTGHPLQRPPSLHLPIAELAGCTGLPGAGVLRTRPAARRPRLPTPRRGRPPAPTRRGRV